MLIALAWIEEKLSLFYAFILDTFGGVSLTSITATLTGSLPFMICLILAALLLCYLGFRLHKLVSGLIAGALFGYLGWRLGMLIGSAYISIQVLMALILGTIGFFFLHIVYPISVFLSSFLFACALYAAVFPASAPAWLHLVLPLVFAAGYCVLYIQHKKIMTALTGGILLMLLLPDVLLLPVRIGICVAAAASGIWVQTILMRKAAEKKCREEDEYRRKYIDHPSSMQTQLSALVKTEGS